MGTLRVATTCLLIAVLLFVISNANAASNSDRAKEKRWEEQIVPGLIVGEAVKLKADGVEFLGLYTESNTEKDRGAVIILHGIGVHPAWPDVIDPLRMELPDHGWHTLSLQMPILENEAKAKDYHPLFPEVPLRLQAGVDYLKSKGINTIVICGHSMGSAMAAFYLASHRDPALKAYVSVSGGSVPGDSYIDTLENLKNIKGVRILELYGSEDTKEVFEDIARRGPVGKQLHGDQYEIKKIDGANHFYQGKQDTLVKVVSDWINNISP